MPAVQKHQRVNLPEV